MTPTYQELANKMQIVEKLAFKPLELEKDDARFLLTLADELWTFLSEKQDELLEQEDRIESIEGELARAEIYYLEKEGECDDLGNKIDDLKEEVEETNRELKSAERAHSNAIDAISQLEDEVAHLKVYIEESEKS